MTEELWTSLEECCGHIDKLFIKDRIKLYEQKYNLKEDEDAADDEIVEDRVVEGVDGKTPLAQLRRTKGLEGAGRPSRFDRDWLAGCHEDRVLDKSLPADDGPDAVAYHKSTAYRNSSQYSTSSSSTSSSSASEVGKLQETDDLQDLGTHPPARKRGRACTVQELHDQVPMVPPPDDTTDEADDMPGDDDVDPVRPPPNFGKNAIPGWGPEAVADIFGRACVEWTDETMDYVIMTARSMRSQHQWMQETMREKTKTGPLSSF